MVHTVRVPASFTVSSRDGSAAPWGCAEDSSAAGVVSVPGAVEQAVRVRRAAVATLPTAGRAVREGRGAGRPGPYGVRRWARAFALEIAVTVRVAA
ncbi:hypothetical protein GCM10008096_14200 [Zhihengliuella salsuginis]|uniref:Uncharacterized protein n=1 Tax=Zhihengliuella salsuginis TaxID=578222 RepID=A0ABQ3GH18_9MICC|nr:hypothetical protein GCM10008096_14200 [Zhihengliuella salsuginis]